MQPFERKFLKSTRNFLLLTNFFFLEQKVGVLYRGGGGGEGRGCFAVQPQTEVGSSPILLTGFKRLNTVFKFE